MFVGRLKGAHARVQRYSEVVILGLGRQGLGHSLDVHTPQQEKPALLVFHQAEGAAVIYARPYSFRQVPVPHQDYHPLAISMDWTFSLWATGVSSHIMLNTAARATTMTL